MIKTILRFICALGAVYTLAAHADDFPSHSLRIIVSAPAGSTPDGGARAISQYMSEALHQPVVVENRPGANGLIAVQEVLKNPDDGYTLLVAAGSTMTINPHIYSPQQAALFDDLVAAGQLYSTDFYLIVRANSGIDSMHDLIQRAKEKPGSLVAANGGPGSASQMAAELLREQAGIDLYPVSFNGSPAAALAVASGNADLLMETQAVTQPLVASGKVKRIAMTGKVRAAGLPDLPTMAEAGVPGMEIASWAGLFAAKTVPADRIAKLHDALDHALIQPEVQAALRNSGLTPSTLTQVQFQRQWRDELQRWGAVVARIPGLKSK
jgi:tripartite-type tricarboxylate transporter receptor subunit TctC